MTQKKPILILTCEPLPNSSEPIGGGGVRAWGLGQGLKHRGWKVVYGQPGPGPWRPSSGQEEEVVFFDLLHQERTIREVDPAVVIVEQHGLANFIPMTEIPLVIDINGPLILENTYRRGAEIFSDMTAKINSLKKADLFLCAGPRQKYYLSAWCLVSGIDLRKIPIEIVPGVLNPELPKRTWSKEPTFVYAGTLWPWIDSIPWLETIAETLDRLGKGKLQIVYRLPPVENPVGESEFQVDLDVDLLKLCAGKKSIELIEALPYPDYLRRIRTGHVGVSLYEPSIEREMAVMSRTLDYLWSGLPVIDASFTELSGLIDSHRAGWKIDAGDLQGLRELVERIVGDRRVCLRRGANAQRLVRENLTWEKTIDALDRFCREPVVRKKGPSLFGFYALEFKRIREDVGQENRILKGSLSQLVRDIEDRQNLIGRLNREIESLRQQADRISELEAKAARIPELEAQAVRVPGLLKLAERLRKLEPVVETVPALRAEADRVPRLEAKIQTLLEDLEVTALIPELEEEIQGLKSEMVQLKRDLEGEKAETARLEGILHSFKSNPVYRLYVGGKRLLQRYLVRWPVLLVMMVLNMSANAYLKLEARFLRRSDRKGAS